MPIDFAHPSLVHRLFDRLLADVFLRPMYSSYAAGLGLRGHERVLELGSGSGLLSRHLAARLSQHGGRLTCIDSSGAMARMARRRLRDLTNIEIRVGNIGDMDIPDGSFDAAVIHFMLHDIDASRRANMLGILVRKIKLLGNIFVREPTMKVHGMSVAEIRRLMVDAGLRELSGRETRSGPIMRAYIGTFERPTG